MGSGQSRLVLTSDQQSLQIQCNHANCWRDGNRSDYVDPATSVEIAAELEIHFPLHLKDYFSTLQLAGKESLAGTLVFVLEGNSPKLKPTRIVFDAQTGLLLKLGFTEFQDYRECGGIKRPFVFVSSAEGQITFSRVQHNQPIPAEGFELQAEAAAPGSSKQ